MKCNRLAAFVTLEAGADDALPTEFRLFKIGANETTKGTFTLTPESAAAVMATYKAQGVDVMVDLNHDSLNDGVRAARSDAGDARGWFKLELRADGLWAVDVRWTPDGAERLHSKKQRYISPAFLTDDAGTIREIVNAALVAMPATHGAPALVAASRTAKDTAARVRARARLYVARRAALARK
jgi:phage I-like protein